MQTLILGWGGSTARRLVPFTELHDARGGRARVFICDGFGSLFRFEQVYRSCEREADALLAAERGRGLLVHLFSDNGFVALCTLIDVLRRSAEGRGLLGRVRGIVLDSAPGLHAADRAAFARRFALALTPPVLRSLRRPAREEHPLITPALTGAMRLYQMGWSSTARRLVGAYETSAAHYPACPHLFLYGKGDRIAPSADVETFAARIAGRGASVRVRRFDTGVHVGCHQASPAAYRRAVAEFHDALAAP